VSLPKKICVPSLCDALPHPNLSRLISKADIADALFGSKAEFRERTLHAFRTYYRAFAVAAGGI
jgi:hypothetical protein